MGLGRAGWAIAVVALAAGCSRGGGSSGGLASVAPGSSAPVTSATPSPTTPSPTTSGTTTTPPAPSAGGRIEILPRGISIDGKRRLLLAGEIQYYRIRDKGFDVAKTRAMWEAALDRLVAASFNMVTTYVPWDYHEEVEGKFDFQGVRDLDAFLELCWKRGLPVQIKPGPFINSEWPNGLGSFGAAPEWFKKKHPNALALGPDGKPFTLDLLGRAVGRQPSFFAPEWRDATRRWFTAVAPILRKYVVDRPTIAVIQIDNETNYYFKSRYASDYSPPAVKQYRDWLTRKYGAIATLNGLYGTSYASFDQVAPPKKAPTKEPENLAAQDWFDAGKEGIAEYHLFLRSLWEQLGFQEPDVLFTTNDSPHAMPAMDLQLWDGPTKNRAGLACLDAYPKQSPLSGDRPLDFPFLTGFFSKRFDESNDLYAFAGRAPVKGRACYAAEIQGGIFDLPLGLKLNVPASTTDHVLLDFLGRGGVMASVYVFQGGLNRDQSSYDFQAAVATDGTLTTRYDVLRRWGRLGAVHGDALLDSDPVEAKVALVLDSRFDAPAARIGGHPGWLQAKEGPAVFGWLEDAGLDPVVLDARFLKKGDLAGYRAVFFLNPDAVHDAVADCLDDYVRQGGTLVNLGHAGFHDGAWKRGGLAETLLPLGLFSDGRLLSVYESPISSTIVPPHVNLRLPGSPLVALTTGPFLGQWDVQPPAEVLARDRTFPFGADGDVAAWRARRGTGQVIFFSTNPAQAYAEAGYYGAPNDLIEASRGLARWLAAQAGVVPLVEAGAEGRVYARRVTGGGAFLFAASRLEKGTTLRVVVKDLAALGLSPAATYKLEDALSGTKLGQATGADLASKGVSLPLGPYGTAVIRLD